MGKVRGKLRGAVRNFGAECRTALLGVVMAFKRRNFIIAVVAAFLIFGALMSLLSGGTAGVGLMFAGGIGAFFNVLSRAFLGLFGVGRSFTDWALIFGISLLQAVVIGLVVLVWRGRRDIDNVERAGIAAGLAVLGSGCPTCGTTLLMPVIIAVVGSEGMALAGAISGMLTGVAVVILLFSLKRLGQEAYTLIVAQELTKKGGK